MLKTKPNDKTINDVIISNNVFEITLHSNTQEGSDDSQDNATNVVLSAFPISPAGDTVGVDGRGYTIDSHKIIKTQKQMKTDIAMYPNHRWCSHEGAVGWIDSQSLKIENGHIVGDIELNKEGSRLVRSKKYRYLSPTYRINTDKAKNDVAYIYEVSLVNHPNLLHNALSNCEDDATLSDLSNNQHGESISTALQKRIEALEKEKKQLTEHNKALQKDLSEATHKRCEMLVNNAIEQGQLAPAKKDFSLSLNEQQLMIFLQTEKGLMDGLKEKVGIKSNQQINLERLSAEDKVLNAQLGIE